MRPVTQSILHDDPDGRPGNCLQAAVASLLELPLQSVPHFVAQGSDWLERMAAFCNAHGYQLQTQPIDKHCAYGMAWGPSERGVRHAVCWAAGRMSHDPHPSRTGLLHVTELIAFTRAPAADGRTPAGHPHARQEPDMAALPTTIAVTCPMCDAPVELPLGAGPHKKLGDRLVVDLTVDTEPLKAHCAAEHSALSVSECHSTVEPAAVATHASLVVNVTRARPDDGAIASALAHSVAKQARMYPFGRR